MFGKLFSLVELVLAEVLVFATMVAVAGVWWNHNELSNPELDEMRSIQNLATCDFLTSTGLLLISEGLLYLSLPIDLIPNFIPVIGYLDNLLAGIVVGLGIATLLIGYFVGTGDKPAWATLAMSTCVDAYHLSQPYIHSSIPVLKSYFQMAAGLVSEVSALWNRSKVE